MPALEPRVQPSATEMPCALAHGVSLSLSVHVNNTYSKLLRTESPKSFPPAAAYGRAMDSNFSPPPPSLGAADQPAGSSRLASDQHSAAAANAPGDTAPRPAAPLLAAARPRHWTLRPPYTVESIFRNFTIRRVALIRALTTDEEAFFNKCETGMPLLCLYGNKDGSWEVKPPEEYLPPDQPEPALGINTSRDNMKRHKWLQEVAMHCNAWLINISFFFGLYLTANGRQRLFTMINSLQTVKETVLASNTYRRMRRLEDKRTSSPVQENHDEEEEAISDDKNFCASCGDRYHANAFWIGCDFCDRWYHGKCVKITVNQAKHIEHYECPECRSDKVGHDYDDDPVLSDLFKRY